MINTSSDSAEKANSSGNPLPLYLNKQLLFLYFMTELRRLMQMLLLLIFIC